MLSQRRNPDIRAKRWAAGLTKIESRFGRERKVIETGVAGRL